jgi:peroxiredoxin (alkyl hydroperoxide reductase subunit C)
MASLIGKPAPDFSSEAVLPDGTFGKVSLSDYKGKYVVLFCYPLSWTFVCPTEIQEFSNAAAELAKVNCEVVGFSVDSKFSTLAWTQSPAKAGGLGPINIPIMEDLNHEISNAYQCLLDDGHTLRGTFIISYVVQEREREKESQSIHSHTTCFLFFFPQ